MLNTDNQETIITVKKLIAYVRKWRILFVLVFLEFIISLTSKITIELFELNVLQSSKKFSIGTFALYTLIINNTIIFLCFIYFIRYFMKMIWYFLDQLGMDGLIQKTTLIKTIITFFILFLVLAFINSFILSSINDLNEYKCFNKGQKF